MSEIVTRSILCDFAETCETKPPFASSILSVTREEAAKEGWITGFGTRYDGREEILDYCPVHAAEVAAGRQRWGIRLSDISGTVVRGYFSSKAEAQAYIDQALSTMAFQNTDPRWVHAQPVRLLSKEADDTPV